MTWTQAELDSLRKAYASGTLRVSYDGKTVEYGSEADLIVTIRRGPSSGWRENMACLCTGANTGVCTGARGGADGSGSYSRWSGAAAAVQS